MSKDNDIIYYKNKIDLMEVIDKQNLKSIDEPLLVCDLEKLKEKYETWQKCLPQIKPYYGKFSYE